MLLALFQLAASMVLVGGNVVVGKLLTQALPVSLILFLRCLLAVVVLAPFAWRGLRWPRLAVLLNLVAQAALGTLGYNIAVLAGLRRTGALEAGLVLSTMPAVVAVGAALLLGERLAIRRWLAVLLAVGGMGALTLRGGGTGGSLAGDALVFLAVCGEAGYMLLAKRNATYIGVVPAAFWMQLSSAVLLAPLALPELASHAAALADWRLSGLLVLHSLTASVLAILLWYSGMQRAPANLAGVFTVLLPATAAVLAVLVLGEAFTPALAAGFTLMLASILLATWPGRRR
jgi:drug/metabolite transporter (DMT)-like permease